MAERRSIQPTYDSSQTGPAYHITYWINGRVIRFQEPIDDPFVHARVTVGWRDLLWSLIRGRLIIEVDVEGDQDRMNDVLELDANTLIGNSSRRTEFNTEIQRALENA